MFQLQQGPAAGLPGRLTKTARVKDPDQDQPGSASAPRRTEPNLGAAQQ